MWCNWDCVKDFIVVNYGESFSYLGAQLGAGPVFTQQTSSEHNFPFSELMIQDTLKSRPIMTTFITGRILQVKSLIASKFVYLFQLIPTPSSKWIEGMERLYYNHVWDQGRHRIAKLKMITPKEKGGFNMLDIRSQEKSLKLKWIDRLMSDTVNISMWCLYTISAFRINITEVLKCNLSAKTFKRLLRKPLPQVWMDIFSIWFEMYYIPVTCSAKNRKDMLLDSMVCYCEPVARCFNDIILEDNIHAFLMLNGIATWKTFLEYHDERLQPLLHFDKYLAANLCRIKPSIPYMWRFIFTANDPNFPIASVAPRPLLCLDGTTTVKECYNYLVSQKFCVNDLAIVKWTVDLEVHIN